MQESPHAHQRRFSRYDLSPGDVLASCSIEGAADLRLASLSQGGCSYYLREIPDSFPASTTLCFFESGKSCGEDSAKVKAECIYVRPVNSSLHTEFLVGFKFEDEARTDVRKIIQRLEALNKQGLVERI